MASTYTLISSQVLGSSAASVTFSSIPSTYTDLVLRISARSGKASVVDWVTLRFNSTTSGYSDTSLDANGSVAASHRASSATYLLSSGYAAIDGANATASTFSNTEIYIPSYTASQAKPVGTFSVQEDNIAGAYMATDAALWNNTATISQIDIYSGNIGSTSFVSGSSFYLYGLKSS